MKDKLLAALVSMLQKTSSGTSVSVLATSSTGDGAIYQAYFFPVTFVNIASNTNRSEEHTSELQSQSNIVCRLLLEKNKRRGESVEHHSQQLIPLRELTFDVAVPQTALSG